MDKSEMRQCRRDVINSCLHTNFRLGIIPKCSMIKGFVREYERKNYGYQLSAYGFPVAYNSRHVVTMGNRVIFSGNMRDCRNMTVELNRGYYE